MADGDGGHSRRLAGVDEPAAVAAEVGLMLGEAAAELDDRLAQLDGPLPADVLAGP